MTNPSILLKDGSEIPEGLMDAFITTAAALHDFKRKGNSRTGSIYICLLYTSPSPRDATLSRMPSSA